MFRFIQTAHTGVRQTFGRFSGLCKPGLNFYIPFVQRIRQLDGKLSSFAIVFMFIFIVLISINNASPSIGFAAFFIFPLTYDWLNSSQIKQ